MAAINSKHVHLPISRVKTIMKSSPEVENISNESIHLTAKATELFIQYLAQESYAYCGNGKILQYKDIAEIVDRDQKLEFLKEIIPLKITFREYKNMMSRENIETLLNNENY